MPEHDTVRGINYPDPEAAGVVDTSQYPEGDLITSNDRRIGPLGDPDATSLRYFLEVTSTDLRDIVTRTSASDPVPTVGDD